MRNLTLLIVSGLLAVLVAEAALRLFVPVPRYRQISEDTIIPDATLGYRLRPNHVSRMSNGYFDEEIRIDARGMRDYRMPDWPDGYLAIGDSQTFGHGLPVTESWPEQLQALLQVNVVNGGVFGWGVPQYEAWLERIGETLPYHTVIVGLTYNDLYSSLPPSETEEPQRGPSSALVHWLREYKQAIRTSSAIGQIAWAAGQNLLSALGVQAEANESALISRNISATAEILDRMARRLAARGKRLYVVYLSSSNLVRDDIWENYRRRHAFERRDLPRQLRQALKSDAVLVDVSDAISRLYEANGRHADAIMIPQDGHYSSGANRVIAERVADALTAGAAPVHR